MTVMGIALCEPIDRCLGGGHIRLGIRYCNNQASEVPLEKLGNLVLLFLMSQCRVQSSLCHQLYWLTCKANTIFSLKCQKFNVKETQNVFANIPFVSLPVLDVFFIRMKVFGIQAKHLCKFLMAS